MTTIETQPLTGKTDRDGEHRCICGKQFAKAFGLGVHQRTCPTAVAGTADGEPLARLVPLLDLHPHPSNPRRELRGLDELAESVAAQGILTPLTVAPRPASKGGGWWIIMGHRRHAAAELAGLGLLPCFVRHDLTAEADVLAAMDGENGNRDELTPIEQAAVYEQLGLLGLNVSAIARRTGRSEDLIRRRLKLSDLPDDARNRIQARQMTLAQAEALAEFTEHPRIVERLISELDRTGDIRAAVARERRELEYEAKRKQKRATALELLSSHGITETSTFRGMDVLSGFIFPELTHLRHGYHQELVDAHQASGCTNAIQGVVGHQGDITLICRDHQVPAGDLDNPAIQNETPAPGATVLNEALGPGEVTPVAREEMASPDLRRLRSEEDERRQVEMDAAEERRLEEMNAESEARRQNIGDCQDAAAVRLAYIKQLVSGELLVDDAMAAAIFEHTATLACSEEGLEAPDFHLLCDLLGIETSDVEDHPDDVIRARVTGLKSPARSFLVALAAANETGFHFGSWYSWEPGASAMRPWSTARQWLDLLGGPLGYEWTEWEQRKLTEADQANGVEDVPAG